MAEIRPVLFGLLPALCLSVQAVPQDSPEAAGFGGSYSSLHPEQKRLIDDWFRRFSAIVKKPVDPAEGFDKIPLSARTTINAVTHALMKTSVTDESGKNLEPSAIHLVDKINDAAGQILGAGGDKQFRIYVQMKPGAFNVLNQSREFKRGADNTIYHKGYPISFRTKGVPSIQISLTRDAARGDIDVDYRSSKFPKAIVNGHLTASNSDVRAGNNDERHNNQWAGLQNWWRNLLGLPLLESQPIRTNGRVLAQEPKRKDVEPAEAVFDFLNSWLVEQKPHESIAYFADEVFACMEFGKRPNADRGMAKFVAVENMSTANKRVGKVTSLAEASAGVTITGERLKPMEQPHHSAFVLYDVREDLAEEFKCANRLDSAEINVKAAQSKEYGKYIAAIFRLQVKDKAGNLIASLWRKDRGYWQMISYEIDPELDRSSAPNVGIGQSTVPPVNFVDGRQRHDRGSHRSP